jgi:hypothetical protein
MDWIKGIQEVVPWLTSLRPIPKAIISALIIGVGAFILVVIWTLQPEKTTPATLLWLISLTVIPKAIISLLIIGIAAFILVLVWTPQPETAVSIILKVCHRRALYTRTQAQMSRAAMFASISECREILQQQIPEIRRNDLQDIAMELLATLEQIERRNPIRNHDDELQINLLKLAALRAFRQLAAATGGSYALPDSGKLAEDSYFTRSEADSALTSGELRNQHAIDPRTGELIPGS